MTTGVLQGNVLAPFLFIIVIDYVSTLSAGDLGYITHTGTRQNQRASRKVTTGIERKLNDLAFADDIALLENSADRSQQQLDAFRINSGKVGLEINIPKTEQMRRNLPSTEPSPANLTINGQKIAIVEDFKYLGSHMASAAKDVQARIGLAWVAFHKLESILKSPQLKVDFRIRLFNASCVSILLYGCETWVLTRDLENDLDIFARKAYRIMLGIRQSEAHMTNVELYKRVNSRPITSSIRTRSTQVHRSLPSNGHQRTGSHLRSLRIQQHNRKGKTSSSIHLHPSNIGSHQRSESTTVRTRNSQLRLD